MTNHLQLDESATLTGMQAVPTPTPERAPERRAATAKDPAPHRAKTPHVDLLAPRGCAPLGQGEELPVDLEREGANMLELKIRQSRCVTPLAISSKATQALLRQF